MRIDPTTQAQILELSEIRTGIDVNKARRESLPERAELTRLLSDASQSRTETARSRLASRDMELDVRKLEADLEKLRRREADDRQTLGVIADPTRRKDLEHDLRSTQRRRELLQEELSEVRQKREAYAANAGDAVTRAEEAVAAVRRALETAEEPLLKDEQRLRKELDILRGKIAPDVLRKFDRLESDIGVAVARIDGRTCQSCFMELDAPTVDTFTALPADEVTRCPECGAYLVRPKTLAASKKY